MKPVLAAIAVATAFSAPAWGQAAHPQFSPDGERLAYFTYDLDAGTATIMLLELASGETRAIETGLSWSVNPSWMPDGERIVFAGADGMRGEWDIRAVTLASGEVETLLAVPGREAHTHVSPDGRHVAFARMGPASDIFLLDLSTQEVTQLTGTEAREFHPKWTGDGTALLFDRSHEDGRSQIIQLDIETGEETVRAGVSSDVRRVGLPAAFGPDGWMYASNFETQGSWSAYDGHYRSYHPGAGIRIGASALRPGHREAAITLDDGEGPWIVLYDLDTEEAREIAR